MTKLKNLQIQNHHLIIRALRHKRALVAKKLELDQQQQQEKDKALQAQNSSPVDALCTMLSGMNLSPQMKQLVDAILSSKDKGNRRSSPLSSPSPPYKLSLFALTTACSWTALLRSNPLSSLSFLRSRPPSPCRRLFGFLSLSITSPIRGR